MLEKLFESLDEKVFTDELKESLEVQFNEAVEAKAVELAEVKIDDLNEKAEEYKAELLKESEAKEAELLESVDSYLEKVVEDFKEEQAEEMTEAIKQEKADMIIEAMDAMLIATGVEISKIVESKDSSSVETELEESVEKYDTLIEENIALEKENAKLIKMGVINEMKEGMSIVEAEKFVKLADIIEFSKDDAFGEKLDTIKESVLGAKSEDKIEDEVIIEEVEKPAGDFSHLI